MNADDLAPIDRRLRALHATMGDNLDALLDLDAGLREVLIAAQHRDLGRTLDRILDVDAGLQAIVPLTEQPNAAPATNIPPVEIINREGAMAALLMSIDDPARLTLRNHPAVEALAVLFTLTHGFLTAIAFARALDVIRNRANDIARNSDLAFDLTRALARARNLARDVAFNLARADDLARFLAGAVDGAVDLGRGIGFGRASDLGRACVLTRDLVSGLDRADGLADGLADDLARDLGLASDLGLGEGLVHARSLARACALAAELADGLIRAGESFRWDIDPGFTPDFTPDFARDLASDLDLARELALPNDRDIADRLVRDLALPNDRDRDPTNRDRDPTNDVSVARDLARVSDLARDLDRARHDFTTADLRGIHQEHARLDGVRWSTMTRWPSQAWRDRILNDSTEIEPGIYEIRGGTTNVPTHTS